MISREFQGEMLPMLAVGTMRLPVIDGNGADIDVPHTEKMFAYAIEHGAKYFDTAWGYHSGNSETVVGQALKAYPRESFYLATKFPGYSLANMDKVEEIFEKQLEKCQVDYFDFYLCHNVNELNIDEYLNESHGIIPYLLKQKERGRIRHLGFSAHGSYEVTKRFLDAYGEHMEFCQLQVNWLDWTFQDAKARVELAAEYGLPVWVMEPVRGGKLASLSPENEAILNGLRPDEGIPAWGFRFLQSLPNVALILGGMSSFDQMVDNISTFEEEKPLTEEEQAALAAIAEGMIGEASLPCTECRYCTDECPQELDIPGLIKLYNQRRLTGNDDFISMMNVSALPEGKRPAACIGCRSCEAVCPQQIGIADAFADFADSLKSA